MTRDNICLKGMSFHTRVGLLPHEAHLPQPLELDLTAWASLKETGQSDGSESFLDYRDLYAAVSETVGDGHHTLLEGLCERISARALSLPGVERVRVAARKPHVPLLGPVEHVEVVIERD